MPNQTDMDALLQTHRLDIQIGKVRVTQQLDLEIRPGQCWCLLGKNGAGKTTLLKTLAGLLPARQGSITLLGQPLHSLPRKTVARHIGMLFQEHHDAFPATVQETVLAGRHPHLHAWQWETNRDNELARQALAFVGLEHFAQRTLDTLSGGERRRVGLATLLSQAPDLYLLDEPGNHLDLHYHTTLLRQFCEQARQRQQAILMAVHDVNLAARVADYCLLLPGNGQSLQGPTDTVLNQANLERLYGQRLEQLDSASGPVWLPAWPTDSTEPVEIPDK